MNLSSTTMEPSRENNNLNYLLTFVKYFTLLTWAYSALSSSTFSGLVGQNHSREVYSATNLGRALSTGIEDYHTAFSRLPDPTCFASLAFETSLLGYEVSLSDSPHRDVSEATLRETSRIVDEYWMRQNRFESASKDTIRQLNMTAISLEVTTGEIDTKTFWELTTSIIESLEDLVKDLTILQDALNEIRTVISNITCGLDRSQEGAIGNNEMDIGGTKVLNKYLNPFRMWIARYRTVRGWNHEMDLKCASLVNKLMVIVRESEDAMNNMFDVLHKHRGVITTMVKEDGGILY